MSGYKRKVKIEKKEKIEKTEKQNTKKEYTRDDYLKDFENECHEMLELTKKKNHDYGGLTDPFKNFREFGEIGILVRMSDKFARLKTVLSEKRELKVNDETIDDTIRDLAVYAIILKIWRKVYNVQNK